MVAKKDQSDDTKSDKGPIKPPVSEADAPVAPKDADQQPKVESDNTQQAPAPVNETMGGPLEPDAEQSPTAGDFVGSDPEATSDTTELVETPDPGAPTAQEASDETGDVSKIASERLEPTKVKDKAEDDASIAEKQIERAKAASEQRAEHLEAVQDAYVKQDDLGEIQYEERELSPVERAVQDVLEEAQRRAGESVRTAQATVAATAITKLGVEAGLDSSNPGERSALHNQRQELVDKVSRSIAELNRYDETAPPPVNMEDADTDNLAEVGPDQTVAEEAGQPLQAPPRGEHSPDEIVDLIIDQVIEIMEHNHKDYYVARRLLQTVTKRLGNRWVKKRDERKSKAQQPTPAPVDPNHMVGPIDGSGNKFNVYADSAGMVGDKQISTPQYMIPFQHNDRQEQHKRSDSEQESPPQFNPPKKHQEERQSRSDSVKDQK